MEFIKKHKVMILIILFIFAWFLGRYEYKMPKRNFADFKVYHYTAQKLIQKENIYDDSVYRKDKIANFKYPPVIALLFYPLGFLSRHAAAVLWFVINFIIIILFFFWSSRLIFGKNFSSRSKNWIYFMASICTLRFFAHNFDEGQVNFLMMGLLTLSLFYINREKSFLSGLSLGFSILVKYMSFVFVPYILFKRKFKVFFYVLISIIIFTILPGLFLGFKYNLFLQKSVLPFLCKTSLDFNAMSTHDNQSLIAMLIRYCSVFSEYNVNFLKLNMFYLGILIGSVVTFLYALILYPPTKFKDNCQFPEVVNYAMIFICVALFNPNGWIHAFIFLTFPYLVAFYYLFKVRHRDKVVWSMVVVSAILGSWPESLFLPSIKDSVDIYSLLTVGSVVLFFALVKIKFFPLEPIER